MSFSSTTNRVSATGNGTTATYSYTFKIFLNTDLLVTVRNPTTGAETTLTLTTHYTVSGVGESGGGSITLVNGAFDWIDGSGYLDTDWVLTMRRVVALTQETDIRNQGSFFPETHEDVFDKHIMIDQQQQDELDRSLKLAETVDVADFDATLPATLVGELSVAIVTNATGDGLAVGPTTTEISNAQGYATAASASATLASQWATTTDDLVAATDNSAKAYAIGGTGAGQPSGGDAKSWATKTSASVAGGEFSSKEYAQGTQASTGGSAKSWSQVTGGDVTGAAANSRSAKSWAQDDNTGATLGGSAKDWAQNTSVPVDGASGYSSKEWALGTQTRGVASSGSAKDWATYTGGTVDDAEYSAKYYSQAAAASASDAATYAAASLWNDVAYKVFGDSPVTLVDGDSGKLFSVDCTSGNVVINLPSIAVLSLTGPWSVGIVKSDSSTNTVTINRDGTDVIDGGTSYTLDIEGQGVTLVPDTDATPDEWTAIPFGNIRTLNSPTLVTPTIDIAVMDGQASTPANPSAGYYKMYVKDASGKLAILDSAGTETEVGSGGASGINYIDNPDAEAGTTGWATYADAAATTPVDGTGGAATIVLSRTTTAAEVLRSVGSFKIAKSAANLQGDGVSFDFDIDLADQGKALTIAFDYYFDSANYEASTELVTVFVYDVTNATLITVNATEDFTGDVSATGAVGPEGARRFIGQWYAASDSSSYRLIFHVAGTGATSWNMFFDNVRVGPESFYNIPIIGETVSFTPTWNNFTLGNGTQSWKYTRLGSKLHIVGEVALGSTSSVTGVLSMVNPISGTTLVATGEAPIGETKLYDDSGGASQTGVAQVSGNDIRLLGVGGRSAVDGTTPFTWITSDRFGFSVIAEIAEWANSSTQMSTTQANLQTVTAICEVTSSSSNLSFADETFEIVDADNVLFDPFNCVTTGASWKFTCPIDGNYEVDSGHFSWASASNLNNWIASVYVNNVAYGRIQAGSTNYGVGGSLPLPNRSAGDYIDVRFYQDDSTAAARTLNASTALGEINHRITIKRIPDFSIIGVYSPYEILSGQSATHTPSADIVYHQHSGNSLTLTPGTWKLFGTTTFGSSGGAPQYVYLEGGWYSANGDNTGTTPAWLTAAPGLTVETSPQTGTVVDLVLYGAPQDFERILLPIVIVTVTQTTTVYANTFADLGTASVARVIVDVNAQRLK